MVRIWRETLGIRSVSVTDDFFELGGDSLLTFRVSLLAREAGYALTPRDLYDYPTLEALARRARTAPALEIDASVEDEGLAAHRDTSVRYQRTLQESSSFQAAGDGSIG